LFSRNIPPHASENKRPANMNNFIIDLVGTLKKAFSTANEHE
jgi:hypothetical protein